MDLSMMDYQAFLQNKAISDKPTGLQIDRSEIDYSFFAGDFGWQGDIVNWALKRGRACLFEDCGMGKGPQALAWSDVVRRKAGPVLISTPLAVATQLAREGNEKFGIECEYRRDGQPSKTGITITNIDMLPHFNPQEYSGFYLDESSILKSYTSKTCNEIIDRLSCIPFRLAGTATPAPNDLMELGNHAEYVGAMTRAEMLSMFFVHDGGETQKWRLKGHAVDDFWRWVCSWAVMIRKPSDLGYPDGNFKLPPLNMHEIVVDADHSKATDGLFLMEAQTLQERQRARKMTTEQRCRRAAEIANSSDEPWLIWCDRNDESELLSKMINNASEIRGAHSPDYKEKTMLGFSDGSVQRIVTKPSIAGFGMNWQHCCKVIFVGLSDSYEQFYQAIRRSWRFGQKNPVDCYVITSEIEGAVVANIKRKEQQAQDMANGMIANMHTYSEENIRGIVRSTMKYSPNSEIVIPNWLRSVA